MNEDEMGAHLDGSQKQMNIKLKKSNGESVYQKISSKSQKKEEKNGI
jgi:hypothetical protein